MAYQSIGLGTTAGDGTGDTIRGGGDKINDNFVEIYTLLGTGSALTSGISATSSVVTLAGPTITGVASFADGSNSAPSITNTGDTNTGIYFGAADTVNVTTGGTKRVDIDSSGLDVTGAITATTTITGATLEATGDTAAGDNAAIGYTSAEGLILTGQGSTSDITLKNDADATVFTVPTGTDDILFPDNAKAMFGAGSDLQIHHDSSNSYIQNSTGNLNFQAKTGESSIVAVPDGAVTLYYDNSAKLATSAAGGTLTGVWVQTANIAADAITGAKIADDTINSEHYAADSIDEEHIANDAVGSAELKTLSTLLIKNSAGSTLKTVHGAGA
jgi:hypothetical protein